VDARLGRNAVDLAGTLVERGALRHSPAGVPVVEFRLNHASEQEEAGSARRVECELACLAMGPAALLMAGAKPGEAMAVGGFLAAKSLKNRNAVLHVNKIEFL